MTQNNAWFRTLRWRPAIATSAPILTRTSPNWVKFRISRPRPKSPRAALKLAKKIFQSSKARISIAQKTPTPSTQIVWLTTLPLTEMGKMQTSQTFPMTCSLHNAPPKILTKGYKIHQRQLAKVGNQNGGKKRLCWTEKQRKLCGKEW